jgi:hypothetical protein
LSPDQFLNRCLGKRTEDEQRHHCKDVSRDRKAVAYSQDSRRGTLRRQQRPALVNSLKPLVEFGGSRGSRE